MNNREALAAECKQLAAGVIGYQHNGQHTREVLYAAIDRLAASAPAPLTEELPPLPLEHSRTLASNYRPLFTADQMRAYAKSAIEGAVRASAPDGASDPVKDAVRQLRKVLGISHDFDDWPIEKLMTKAVERLVALQGASALPQEPPKSEWMPIHGTQFGVRMSLLDERQAQKNHGQSLQRLAERGGLGLSEATAIMERREWRSQRNTDAAQAIMDAAKAAAKES